MKTLGIFFALLLLTFAALHLPAQRNGIGANNWANLPGDGSVWAFNGQYAAGWRQPMRNLVTCSDDLSCASWTKTGIGLAGSVVTASAGLATHRFVSTTVSFPLGVYTLAVRLRYINHPWVYLRIGGTTTVLRSFNIQTCSTGTASSGSPVSSRAELVGSDCELTLVGNLTPTQVAIFGFVESDSITESWTAVGTEQFTFVRAVMYPGSLPLPYQRTGTGQTVADLSGTAPMTLGSNASAADTNDPSVSVYSRNLLAAGSTQDLTNAAWTTNGVTRTATTLQDTSTGVLQYASQTTAFPANTAFTYQIWILKDGVASATRFPAIQIQVLNTDIVGLDTSTGQISSTLDGPCISASSNSDGNYWKLSVSCVTDDALGINVLIYPSVGANSDLVTTSATAIGTITILQQQLEVGTTATAFTSPATNSKAVGYTFTTDDYTTAPAALPGDWTIIAGVNPTANGKGLLRQNGGGVTRPTVSLDANGKVAVGYSRNLLAVGSATSFEAASWQPSATVTAVDNSIDVLDPDGGNTSSKITFAASGTTRQIYQAAGPTDTSTGYSSVYVRSASGTVDFWYYGNVNDENDKIAVSATTDWQRIALVKDSPSSSRGCVMLRRVSTQSDEGIIYAWHPQFELGSSTTTFSIPGAVATATTAPSLGMFSVIGITQSGGVITHYLNGAANGSTAAVLPYPITSLQVGYDGSAYYEGRLSLLAAYPYAWNSWQMAQYTRNIAEQECPQRGILCSLKQSMESSGLFWPELWGKQQWAD